MGTGTSAFIGAWATMGDTQDWADLANRMSTGP
jgi:hypothetical protein